MNAYQPSIIQTEFYTRNHIHNRFRLIHTVDVFQNTDVFSVFLTTESPDGYHEEFVYDIARHPATAKEFFRLICQGDVSATSLRDIAEDFVASTT